LTKLLEIKKVSNFKFVNSYYFFYKLKELRENHLYCLYEFLFDDGNIEFLLTRIGYYYI